MNKLYRQLLCGLLIVSHLHAVAAVPPVALANTPLYTGGGNVHPNMLLDLSVEFPTVKSAYPIGSVTYDRTQDYIGYFNFTKCYSYPGGNAQYTDYSNNKRTVATPEKATVDVAFFSISSDADVNHECPHTFSGNFMNWASSSAIDMLRLSLTGGDRIIDTQTQTVLQRAFLKITTVDEGTDFYRSGYFPQVSITSGGTVSAPYDVTPFNVNKLYIVNCENKIQFSESGKNLSCGVNRFVVDKSGNVTNILANTDKLLGEYLVRVQVCDDKENTTRADLCLKYPSGSYKSVGQMQRNQNAVRYGAFGYLLDSNTNRYGGVLRAPLKYVGSKQYTVASKFEAIDNDRAEWDLNTGVFNDDPENDLVTHNSGVINYLNKFGRSGGYKGHDPVSELFYESIRYLQGKGPTVGKDSSTDATFGVTDAMRDNFQIVTTWGDPIELACQKNYIVSIADANTHRDKYIPGNTRANSGDIGRSADLATSTLPAFDVMQATASVAAMESSSAFGNPKPDATLNNLSQANTGADAGTFYMAGIAYWANTNNIRLDKPVRVKTFSIDVDENGNGSIDNINRSATAPRRSQIYLAAKYGGFNDVNLDGNPFKTFDSDNKTVILNNNEWTGTAIGGDPKNYFLASNPKKLIASIGDIFNTVTSSGGSLSGVGISSTSASDNPYVYEPGFNSERWSGSLLKKSATADATTKPLWDAGVILSGDTVAKILPTDPASKKIYTSKVDLTGALKTVEFTDKNSSNFDTASYLALNSDPNTSVQDNLASDRINYLRGDRSKEQQTAADGSVTGKFRVRAGVLGDIVNSAPVYYGAPAKNISEKGYSTFYTTNASRQKAVYVGSNDGMLHAFDADKGTELFAFIPGALLSQVNQLTTPNYTHRAFVDGKMTVREAQLDPTKDDSWKTLLVSGMGSGAKGVFALDVTNPANFAAGKGAIWEFTDSNDPDMGYVLTPPIIAKFLTGTSSGGNPVYGNFVVVASGYNNYISSSSTSGQGALFLLSLNKKDSDPWVKDTNYFKLVTSISNTKAANGLSAPTVVTGGDGAAIYAYAGDLQGNLWRFDFSIGKVSNLISPKIIFTALSPSGDNKPQPITSQPRAIFAPGGGYVVYFGTGKYLESDDTKPSKYDIGSYYAILDTTFNGKNDKVNGRSDLAQRTAVVNGNGFTITGDSFTYGITGNTKKGWYLDFNNSSVTGERVVTTSAIAGTNLFFNSLILSTDPCTGGNGRKYQLDTITGLSDIVTGTLSTIGLMTSPIIININTTTGDRNAVGTRKISTKISVRTAGTGGVNGTSDNSAAPDAISRAGRISWRELQNWQELRNDANK